MSTRPIELIRTLSTADPKGLVAGARWVVSLKATMGDLLERVIDEGISDLFVVDDGGQVVGIVGNGETSIITHSMSKKKWAKRAQLQEACQNDCSIRAN